MRGRSVRDALAFERMYAERSFLDSVEALRESGRVIAPCNCDVIVGPHWQCIPRDIMEDYIAWGRVPSDWVWPPPNNDSDTS